MKIKWTFFIPYLGLKYFLEARPLHLIASRFSIFMFWYHVFCTASIMFLMSHVIGKV